MIDVVKVSKKFESVDALNDVSLTIADGSVFGLLGTNGAGKSTLLRLMSGILKADAGSITIDGEAVYENSKAKEMFCFLSDDQYFFPDTSVTSIADYYEMIYPKFDRKRYMGFLDTLHFDRKRKIRNLSKGMKKQVSILLGICTNTKYLFCDETFDGLDPVIRQAIKSVFAKEVSERDFTPVIASHNLRELEDICDSVGLLHKGGVLLSKDIMDMKVDTHKVQFVVPETKTAADVLHDMEVLTTKQQGKLVTATVRSSEQALLKRMEEERTVFYEILPLNLEEIFISETEVAGYDIRNLI